MILSGKKLFMYRVNQIKELILMTALVVATISFMFFMCVAF